ncbi:MAG: hypothetical protein D6776_09970 [Planctomycetota bacterium]|nr:MAG: hypothetical protein D6776_09970 [Planctomycetota bacterium]
MSITLAASDDGLPSTPGAVSYRVTSLPAHGKLTGSLPDVVYTPDPGFEGQDSFSYVATDGERESAPATVTITVSNNVATGPGSPLSTAGLAGGASGCSYGGPEAPGPGGLGTLGALALGALGLQRWRRRRQARTR